MPGEESTDHTSRGDVPRRDLWVRVAAATILLMGMVGVLDLTLIPHGLDDTYRGLTASNDGPDYATLYTHESGAVPTFAVVIERAGGREAFHDGQSVRKERWSTTMQLGDREVALTPPVALYEYLGALVLLVAVGLWRWSRRPLARDG